VRFFLRFLIVLVIVSMGLGVVYAQEIDDAPTVQVVLFYSPTCPHCHHVIDNVLPGVMERFGNQLEVIYVDVSQQGGAMVFYDACDAMRVPDAQCGGVPAMVIGDAYLVGSAEIPARMETLVQAGLDSGGLNLSHLPLLWSAIEAQNGTSGAADAPVAAPTVMERFQSDLLGNSTAVLVLLALVCVLGLSLRAGWQVRKGTVPGWLTGNLFRGISAVALLGGVLIVSGIIFAGGGIPSLLAIVIAVLMFVALVTLFLSQGLNSAQTLQAWRPMIPVVAVAGLVTAGYLAYVEVGSNEAICGVVGDCNAVQASAYASILGVPVGLLGVLGYGLMLVAWAVGTYGSDKQSRWADAGLLLIVMLGTAFSIYLTFLEPFVIGAVCAWCITSALTMIALVGMVGPFGWLAIADLLQSGPDTGETQPTKRVYFSGQ
jgi:uncharacterized membrane protein